ncbi:MAG: Plug domain-containing protein, partial [Lachnospiraceae bacterium]|nr:Plug domain-containing protein [Lachnospiraceae bacterium]
MRTGRILMLSALCILAALPSFAQSSAWDDTLQAAVKTDSKRLELSLGRLHTGLEGIRGVLSPVGEGDPIRWVQGLPGVTTGADGTTAMYVRGGSSGNNLFTLDGVPVYGYSHILGLTTLVPTAVIESAELNKGGFDGSESNFNAAHLLIHTKDPSATQQTSFALNNFLLSAATEGPLGKKLSYITSFRISPL